MLGLRERGVILGKMKLARSAMKVGGGSNSTRVALVCYVISC